MEKPVAGVLSVPECLKQSPQQCREVHLNARAPIEWALPLYGFLMPLIVAITILTNSFIVIVLSHRSLRTPTNFVLGAMAITELLTGLLSLPWHLYYYTFGGYRTYEWEGLPAFWCTMSPYLASSLPSIFHTAAIWLTVYLAVQRYIYICVPKLVQSLCTIRRSKQMIVTICVVSLWIYAPELFASYNRSFSIVDTITNRTRSMCVAHRTALIQLVGTDLYHMMYFAVHTIIDHTLPCILLVFFTWRLITAIREADKKHCNLIRKKSQQQQQLQYPQRKTTVATTSDGGGGGSPPLLSANGCSNNDYDDGGCANMTYCSSGSNGTTACGAADRRGVVASSPPPIVAETPTISTNGGSGGGTGTTTMASSASSTGGGGTTTASNCSRRRRTSSQQQQEKQRGSFSESKRVQGLRQNTRMLLTVILLFLVTEIPAALIFGMHVGAVALKFTFLQQRHYAIINKLLIVRNVLIVISYPLRFAIYCGMSAQFREVVKQMLAKRKMLFHHFSYGKLSVSGPLGGGAHPRASGGGRKNEEAERSSSTSIVPARKTTCSSTATMAMVIHQQRQQQQQRDTGATAVIWRNGTGGSGGAIGTGERDETMTAKLIKEENSETGGEERGGGGGGAAYLARQITTVTTVGEEVEVGNEEAEEEGKNNAIEEEEETDEMDECRL